MDNNDLTQLPMMTFKEIPKPKEGAQSIVALVKNSGRITGYQLADGRIISKEEGVSLAKAGEIQGVGVATRKGNEYLRTLPDNEENNNLSNLPTVKN
ncbi:MAG: DUF3892 domain-containing protein [Oscillospiraceae bacterium]|jgi:hypothetical protein|nr:DUF3892 domain-containing protein [Oscillospiraceae bacterium]